MDTNPVGPQSQRIQIALTIVGVSAIALIFLPFADDQVPFRTVLLSDDLDWATRLVVLPCIVLPFLISVGYARWLATGQLPPWSIRASYLIAGLSALVCIMALSMLAWIDIAITIAAIMFTVAFAGAVLLIIKGVSRESMVRGLVAMQSVYVVLMSFWVVLGELVAWPTGLQVGGWLAILVLLAYLVQIALVATRSWWLLSIVVPILPMALWMTVSS